MHCAAYILSDSKHVLLLLSDLLHLYLKQLMGEGSAREGVDGGEAPAKRAKGTPPLESILLLTFPASQAAAQPQVNWLQFLCVLSEYMFGVVDVSVPISSNRRPVSGLSMFLRVHVFGIPLVQGGPVFSPFFPSHCPSSSSHCPHRKRIP